MQIRPVANDHEVLEAYHIETMVYPAQAAATLDAFRMRKEVFGGYFLVAMTEADSNGHQELIGVTNGVKLEHKDLADESIKQGVSQAVDGRYFCVLTIAVHPSYQRQGIATQLLEQIIARAREDGLAGIVLMCEEHLILFYEKQGFRYIAPSASEHGGIQWHEMHLIWK
ncbi:GNAT family N-acetyltransferase [Paenibacillus sp. GCM10023248]|uniref:GNAT family N-acetyltransferase n=1 Tax=Bacillales TaxID=1385 RepID=UPI0023794D44|nr:MULTISPECIES: GNAT family N-acetyltransferase [Bacillales]MDD9265684.1 GNAT family N-acetyltransferase [Paenibacillus sp. MAHUQ-63]MDR6878925.1 ribosomal protein S18 acetylase RimI-like enzyme [Bacillus sp. 3255]